MALTPVNPRDTPTSEAYRTRIDSGATYTYVGDALTGTATSASSWRILRVTNATGDIDWADGNETYDNIWDNRASLSYS